VSDFGNVFAEMRAREFDWRGPRIYLNAASFGPLPGRAHRAITHFNERRWQAALTDPDLVAGLIAARASAARLINATSNEIALAPNTNIGVNIGATAALKLADSRRVIVISDREFPANVYPWLALEREGFRIEILPTGDNGWPREDAMLERISRGDVAAASVSFVQFASGFRADLRAIGEACRAQQTLFVVDAIQGLGAVPLDVRDCGCDILACGGQKWLCGPWGSGFTYIREELITQFEPLLPGWISFNATQDFTKLTDYRYEMLDDARRFETGSLGFQDYLGLNESLELLLELGTAQTWQHIQRLQEPIIDFARARGIQIISDLSPERRSGILCIRPESADKVYEALAAAEIRCALRENSIRISPHWYNNQEDVARFLEVLEGALPR
jgi:selenocysteine lyase/cysteine desulfurase